MGVTEWSGVISTAMAVFSVIGAGVAWWLANKSKTARDGAEHAKQEAQRAEQRSIETLATMKELSANSQQQAESTKDIVEELKRANDPTPSGLTLQWHGENFLVLRNERQTKLGCECVRNRDEFFRIDLVDAFEIDSHRSIDFIAIGAMGLPLPNELIFDEVGKDEPTVVPIPPKP